MVKPADAQRAREALRKVGEQIDDGEIEATTVQRAYIAGAVDALDAVETEQSSS
jgi:hypothetical protein